MMAAYLILNRVTKEQKSAEADSFEEACRNLGWQVGDCYQVKKFSDGDYQA